MTQKWHSLLPGPPTEYVTHAKISFDCLKSIFTQQRFNFLEAWTQSFYDQASTTRILENFFCVGYCRRNVPSIKLANTLGSVSTAKSLIHITRTRNCANFFSHGLQRSHPTTTSLADHFRLNALSFALWVYTLLIPSTATSAFGSLQNQTFHAPSKPKPVPHHRHRKIHSDF